MNTESKYWNLVTLRSSGDHKVVKIAQAQLYFEQHFLTVAEGAKMSEQKIQRDLVALTKIGKQASRVWAEKCLRCYISHQIRQTCYGLEQQFGSKHGFGSADLFPYVLDDTFEGFRQPANSQESCQYQPLSVKILKTFDPEKASLSTWTTRYVKQDSELKKFLLERGVFLISNWAILNDTNLKQLERILVEYYNLTSTEVAQLSILLTSYHDVYRHDRFENMLGKGQKCLTPSQQQLEKIADLLKQNQGMIFTAQQVLFQLEQLAKLLREYRIQVRNKRLICALL